MENNLDTRNQFKQKFFHIFVKNKIRLIFIVSLLITFIFVLIYYFSLQEKKNSRVSELYILAGLKLASEEIEKSTKLYEDVIQSKNKFYSILALNTILEKNLIKDEQKIIKYFQVIENMKLSNEQKDLIKFKKALFLIKYSNDGKGKKILEKLATSNSTIKKLANNILKDK